MKSTFLKTGHHGSNTSDIVCISKSDYVIEALETETEKMIDKVKFFARIAEK